MENFKIYPKKIAVTMLIIFFIGTILFSAILLTVSIDDAIYCIFIGIIVSFLMAGLNYALHRIIVKDSEFIIKMDGDRGYKKYKITLSDILKLEYINKKSILNSRMHFFTIYYKQGQEEMFFRINDSIYMLKDLKALFEFLELKCKTHYDVVNED